MAKLRVDQLPKNLQRLTPVYLVTGDEMLLVQEACDSIRRAASAQGYQERELYHTDAGFQWETLNDSANAMSLFADKKVIEVRVHNGKPGDAGSKAISEYCANANGDNLLLLVMPKIDRRSQNSKWFKAIDALGVVVNVWPVSAQQLPRWVGERLEAAGLFADREAIDILCAKVEGNLLAAVQEIEKLKLITSDHHIDATAMADAVTDSARYDVFSLVDKAIRGDSRGAITSLQGLRGEGTDATLILWALAREIRTLTTIKESVEQGKSFDLAAKQMGVWDNRKPLIQSAIYHAPVRHFYTLIRKCSQADKMIKGLINADVWSALTDIVLSLAGTDVLDARSRKLGLQLSR